MAPGSGRMMFGQSTSCFGQRDFFLQFIINLYHLTELLGLVSSIFLSLSLCLHPVTSLANIATEMIGIRRDEKLREKGVCKLCLGKIERMIKILGWRGVRRKKRRWKRTRKVNDGERDIAVKEKKLYWKQVSGFWNSLRWLTQSYVWSVTVFSFDHDSRTASNLSRLETVDRVKKARRASPRFLCQLTYISYQN